MRLSKETWETLEAMAKADSVIGDYIGRCLEEMGLTLDARILDGAVVGSGTARRPEPQEDQWYWVRLKVGVGHRWFPAMRSKAAAGGWTNQDTWEDFDREVVEYRQILPPAD